MPLISLSINFPGDMFFFAKSLMSITLPDFIDFFFAAAFILFIFIFNTPAVYNCPQ